MTTQTTGGDTRIAKGVKLESRPRVEPETIDAAERARVEEFVRANESSPVSILLRRLLTYTERGLATELLAEDSEVTPNEAAKILQMSRPHLLTFMDRGHLPFHRVGTHRRIKMTDLLDFMEKREAGRILLGEATHKPLRRSPAQTLSDAALKELEDL